MVALYALVLMICTMRWISKNSRSDWSDKSNPQAYESFVDQARQAAEDGREGREVTAPEWNLYELNSENSVSVNIAGTQVQMPIEVWERVEGQMSTSETRYQTGRNVREEFAADSSTANLAATENFTTAASGETPVTQEPVSPQLATREQALGANI